MKKTYLYSFCARCLTLLVLALLSTNLAWGDTTYKLVTSTTDLKAGCRYIIGNGTDGSVNFMSTESNSNNRKVTSGEVNESKVSSTGNMLVLELGGTSGAWTLKTTNYLGTNGYLASASSGSNNHCRVIATETTATISFNSNAAVINLNPHTSRTLLRYNANNGSPIFACYSSGQSSIYLYKEEDAAPSTDATATFTLNGESIDFTNNSFTKNVAWNADDAGGYSVAITPATGATVTDVDGASGDASPYNIAAPTAGSTSTAMFEITAQDGKTTEIYEINITKAVAPEVTYTVTFDANGGEGTMDPILTDGEQQISLPECEFTYTGKVFDGWKLEGTSTIYPVASPYNVTGDVTFEAQWRDATQYTITWMVNGTSITTGNPTLSVYEGESITKLPTDPSIVNYIFKGWTSTPIATSSPSAPDDLFTDADAAPAITGNTTFYAVFAQVDESTETLVIKDYAAANNWEDSKPYTDASTTNVTFKGAGSGNNCKYYTSDNSWRFYSSGGGAITITAEENITKVELSGTSYFTTAPTGWSYNENVFTPEGTSQTKIVTINNGSGTSKITNIAVTYNSVGNYRTSIIVKELTGIEVTGTPANFWKGGTFNHDGIIVTAHYSNADDEDVTNKATFTGYNMDAAGEQTVTVTYEGKTATYNITVKTIANTKETAYTTAKAKELIDAGKDLETEVYVKGTVSKVDKIESSAITYWLDENAFEVYKGKNIEGADFTNVNEIAVGDEVVIYGKIKKYSSTYELDQNNYLVSHVKAATLSIDNITVSLGEEISPEITSNVPEAERTITYSVASEDVVKVQDGKLVTVAVGGPVTVTATLTAEGYKNATTTFDVTVIKALQSIEVKTAPTTISYKAGDKFDPTGLVITAKYNDESTEDVAYAGNEDKFTFTPSLETPLAEGNTSVTITYAGKEATQEISVRELYKYDITWMANGEQFTTTQVTEGNTLALPETKPTAMGYVFTGWIKSENYYSANTAPEYIVPAEIIPTEAMTFYAVFAKQEGEGKEGYKNVTSFTEGRSYIFGAVKANASATLANNTEIGAVAFTNTYNDASSSWGKAVVSLTPNADGIILASNENITDNCIWVLESISDGNYQFKNGNNYLYIGTSVGSTTNGAQCGVNTSEGNMYLDDANATCSKAFLVHPSKNQTNVMLWNTSNGYRMYAPRSYTASMTPYIRFYEYNPGVTYSDYRTSTDPRSYQVSVSPSAATGLTTLYLDYATEIPEDAEAWYVSAYDKDADRLTMTQIEGYVPANTAIIVKGTAGVSYEFVETSEEVVDVTGNLLSGSVTDYAAKTYTTDDGWYYLATSGNFKKYEGENIVRKAHKAYLHLADRPWSVSAKELSIDWEPTGIKDVQGTKMKVQGSAYNLNGVRVNENYKGIVIMNGKKYINK